MSDETNIELKPVRSLLIKLEDPETKNDIIHRLEFFTEEDDKSVESKVFSAVRDGLIHLGYSKGIEEIK